MNDDELELLQRETQLRGELHRRVVPPAAPDRLLRHVGALALDAAATATTYEAADGGLPLYRMRLGARFLGGLAAAACIVALLAAGLMWRSSHTPSPVAGTSASASAGVSAGNTADVSARPSGLQSPVPVPTSDGLPIDLRLMQVMDADWIWIVGHPMAPRTPISTSAVVPEKLYVTYDGGATWETKKADLPAPWPIVFTDRRNGWIPSYDYTGWTSAGDQTRAQFLYKTSDGGDSWSKLPSPVPSAYMPVGITAADGQHLWVLAYGMNMSGPDSHSHARLWSTADGGATWKLLASGMMGTVPTELTMVSALEGWGSVDSKVESAPALLAHTVDGWRTWSTSTLPLPSGYATIWRSDPPRTGSGGSLTLTAMVSTQAQTASATGTPSWGVVTWTSVNDGKSWTVDSVVPIGTAASAMVSGGYVTIADADHSGVARAYDTNNLGVPITFDATTVCGGPDANVSISRIISTQKAWVNCWHTPPDPSDGSYQDDYLFGTTDGGKTWSAIPRQP